MHASPIVFFSNSVLHILVFSHLKQLLYLLRKLVGGEVLVGLLQVRGVYKNGRKVLLPVKVAVCVGGRGEGRKERELIYLQHSKNHTIYICNFAEP